MILIIFDFSEKVPIFALFLLKIKTFQKSLRQNEDFFYFCENRWKTVFPVYCGYTTSHIPVYCVFWQIKSLLKKKTFYLVYMELVKRLELSTWALRMLRNYQLCYTSITQMSSIWVLFYILLHDIVFCIIKYLQIIVY